MGIALKLDHLVEVGRILRYMLEIQMLEVILVKSQMETSSTFLETEGKVILIIKW